MVGRCSLLACVAGFFLVVGSAAACKGSEGDGADKAKPDKATADLGKEVADLEKKVADLEKPPTDVDKPPASTAKAGTVRVAIAFEIELLKSEARAIGEVKKKLAKNKDWTLSMSDAADDEKAAAAAYAKGEKPSAMPSGWADNETVIILSVANPLGKKPKRISQGVGSIVVVRPPSLEPVYLESIEGVKGDSGNPLDSEALAKWTSALVSSFKE